jgi:hypothetical protein
MAKKFKSLSPKFRVAIANEVKLMMAAHRDALWTRWTQCSHPQAVDPTKVQSVCNEGYYGEAFGIVRGMVALRYGYFGSDNLDAVEEDRSEVPEHNLKWWFSRIVREYLDEEGFFEKTCSAEKCTELLEQYRNLVRK